MGSVPLPTALPFRRTAYGAAGAQLLRGAAQCATYAVRSPLSVQRTQHHFGPARARASAGPQNDRAPGRFAAAFLVVAKPVRDPVDGRADISRALPGDP